MKTVPFPETQEEWITHVRGLGDDELVRRLRAEADRLVEFLDHEEELWALCNVAADKLMPVLHGPFCTTACPIGCQG